MTGCRTSRRWCRPRSRPSSSGGCSRPASRSSRRRSFVHPKWVPQLADAEELLTRLGDAGRAAAGAGAQRARPRPRARPRRRDIAIFGSATETFAQKNLNRSLDEQFAMFSPTVTRARGRGAGRPRLRVDVLRRPVGGRRAARPGGRRRRAAVRPRRHQLSLGDTIGVATRRPGDRADRRLRRGRVSPSTSSRCTSTTPTARPSPTRSPALQRRRHDVRRQRRRPRRLPVRQERHRQPRHRGPRLACSTASASTRRRPGALVATSAWLAGHLGRPSPSAVVRALA